MGEPDPQLAQSYLLPFPFLVAVCQPSSESDDEDCCCVGAGGGGRGLGAAGCENPERAAAWDCSHGGLPAPR